MSSSIVFISSLHEDYFLYINYEAIGVHAICRSPEIYKQHCIYCQVSDPNDTINRVIDFSPNMSMNEDLMEEEPRSVEEVFFSPNNPDELNLLFEQISVHQMATSKESSDDEDFFMQHGELAFDRDVEELFRKAQNAPD